MFPKAYILYLVHFHSDRDYFECHEVLEEYWKTKEPRNKQSIWVGLILFAVSNYHYRRGNISGAKRTLEKAIRIIKQEKKQLHSLGLNSKQFLFDLEKRFQSVTSGQCYKSYDFPINNLDLLEECKQLSLEKGMKWTQPSDMDNEDLLHRHANRDRTDVIKERARALQNKKR